jgi:S1-C subfamily serine protease
MGAIGNAPTQIIQVSETSVADRAGLVVGDVLLELGGRPVDSSVGLRQIVSEWRWGDVVAATIERDGKSEKIDIAVRRAVESAEDAVETIED